MNNTAKQLTVANINNQIQGQGQTQPNILDMPLQMPIQKQKQATIPFELHSFHQQPAHMQTLQPSAMSARGLPLAPPGFIK